MKRLLVLSIGGALALGAVGLIAVNAQQRAGRSSLRAIVP